MRRRAEHRVAEDQSSCRALRGSLVDRQCVADRRASSDGGVHRARCAGIRTSGSSNSSPAISARRLAVWSRDGGAPAFYAEPAAPDDAVRAHLLGSDVFYLGSHEGCGCGFCVEGHEHDEDWELRRASLRAMIEYIARVSSFSKVQVWVGWEGDQAKAPDSLFELTQSRLREADAWTTLLAAAHNRSHLVTIPADLPDSPDRDDAL